MFKVIAGYSIVFFLLIPLTDLFALDTLKIVNGKEDYLVDGPFMQLLVDKSKKLTINDVSSPAFSAQFKNKGPEYPREDLDAAYWTRFYVRNESDYNKWLLEIVDPHINHIEIYMEDSSGNFIKSTTGNYLPFLHREYIHKNFVYDLNVPPSHSGFRKYYVRMESENTFALFYNIRSNRYFGRYALNEYYLLGMYYGMILVMALYNLLMFFTFREKAYIFYVLYVLTGGMMSLLEDGTGFEYIWPSHPGVNQWIYIFAPILFLIFFTLYAKSFLEVRRQDERLNKIINISLILYFCYLLIDLFISPKPPVFAVFIIPFVIMFIAAIMVFLKGYRPARYFIVGYSFVIISFFLYLLRINGLLGPGDPLSVYVFNYGLIFEIVIFSVAMSDRVRIIKMEKESAQKKMIEQLVENEKLIDKTNKELETKVEARTMEINKKSKDITDSITYAKRLQEAILPDERIAGMIL
ncbi:MAG: 7TM diverse intracellular signaling domain-containing protein, partial [Cytophagaceae bacterium]